MELWNLVLYLQLFLAYSGIYRSNGISFSFVNDKIEEFSAAKSAAQRGLPLFCVPGCTLSHNRGELPFTHAFT